MKRLALIPKSKAVADAITEILGLPDTDWNDLEVSFGHDQVATARISLLLSHDQLAAIVNVTTGASGT